MRGLSTRYNLSQRPQSVISLQFSSADALLPAIFALKRASSLPCEATRERDSFYSSTSGSNPLWSKPWSHNGCRSSWHWENRYCGAGGTWSKCCCSWKWMASNQESMFFPRTRHLRWWICFSTISQIRRSSWLHIPTKLSTIFLRKLSLWIFQKDIFSDWAVVLRTGKGGLWCLAL